jgi:hypothetical protein
MDMGDFQPEPPCLPELGEPIVKNAGVRFDGLDRSQHFIDSHRYEINGDRATIMAHMRAGHSLHTGQGGDRDTVFGTYTDDAIRTPDGRKLVRVKLAPLPEEGKCSVKHEATRRGRK